MGFFQLHVSQDKARTKRERFRDITQAFESGADKTEIDAELPKHGHHQLVQLFDLLQQFQHPEAETLHKKSMQALLHSAHRLLQACSGAVDAIVDAMHTVNNKRWIGTASAEVCQELHIKHTAVLQQLKREQERYVGMSTEHLLDPHRHLFDQNGRINDPARSTPVHGLLFGLVYEECLLTLATSVQDMLVHIVSLEQQKTKVRLWPPTGLEHAITWAFSRDELPSASSPSTNSNTPGADSSIGDKAGKKVKKIKAEGHGAREEFESLKQHGGRKRSGPARIVIGTGRWISNTEGVYALRVLLVTIALTLPAVIQHSAGFYYRERGLRALIMAQTGLVFYSADFVYGFICRAIGTVFGGVLGMVCWYTGAGSGSGNPYGLAAVMAPAIVCLMWGRLFASPAILQGVILSAATVFLVVGYSWDDTHIPSYGNPGVGYSVFWRRTLLILIGFTASAIVTFLPCPPSAARHYCKVLSDTLRSSKDLYALLLSSWAHPYKDLGPTAEKATITIAETLSSIAGPIELIHFEISSSNFDGDTLHKVVELCTTTDYSLSQLFMYGGDMSEELKFRFAHLTGALDHGFVGDFMAVLSLIEQALKSGDPLPVLLPTPLLGRSLRYITVPSGEDVLTLDLVRSEAFRKYCAVLSAFVGMLGAIDELVLVVKDAVGEAHDVPAWHKDLWRKNV